MAFDAEPETHPSPADHARAIADGWNGGVIIDSRDPDCGAKVAHVLRGLAGDAVERNRAASSYRDRLNTRIDQLAKEQPRSSRAYLGAVAAMQLAAEVRS